MGHNEEKTYVRTVRECSDRYDWEKFCSITGYDFWCLNEGLDPMTLVWFTREEAKLLGIV